MKEYTKEFEGVTYTFTEGDLSEPFSYGLIRLKEDIAEAEKRMGTSYTKELKNKVYSLLDEYVVYSYKYQVFVYRYVKDWSQCVNPKNSLHNAFSIGSVANESRQYCTDLQNDIAEKLSKIGVPVCKQII